ncbi:hypothetical protein [Bacillus sp. SM2101]|uniref:hypothetical protein n=1 Tax=Bacillus sp. SM2101 TaxID=2805366 RepID=UPI001BDE2B3C|nr:hypothetical protein [Bacillus sp. SM2101]
MGEPIYKDYFLFGVGYTVLNDEQMIEVRSLSKEAHRITDSPDILPPSFSPEIQKSHGKEWAIADVKDEDILQCLDQGLVYREWILEKDDYNNYLKVDSLMDIDLKELKTKNLRKYK